MKYLIITILLLTSLTLDASEEKEAPCSSEEYRQFDFWIGQWEVFDPKGQKVGENMIKKILGGCSLQESWRGVSGNIGHSYNIYDRATSSWHQTWVDNGGTLLKLDGGMEGDSMVIKGLSKGKKGVILNKITWTPRESGSVQQVWELSMDDGETWQTVFDGLYKKVEGEQ